MNQDVLNQYADLKAEIKDLRRRAEELTYKIEKLKPVTDSVSGTRLDGTIGCITVTGFPEPEYYRKKALLKKYKLQLESKELELLEVMSEAEKYIESIDSSELRSIFRLLYIDGLTYIQTANHMNALHPKRRKRYTDENIRKKIQRFFQMSHNVRF